MKWRSLLIFIIIVLIIIAIGALFYLRQKIDNYPLSSDIQLSPADGIYTPDGCRANAAQICNTICNNYCSQNPFPFCNTACYYTCMERVRPAIEQCEDYYENLNTLASEN